jgi:uncharacterized membrane protein YbaN (DUF454 family)
MTPAGLIVPVGHALHWAEPLLYATPFLLLIVWVLAANRRDKRLERTRQPTYSDALDGPGRP